MDWTKAVDIYCERTAVGFWNEPFNALSNLSFVVFALWAALEARRRGVTQGVVWLLIVLAGAIGIGSFLFHTFANRWSELADTFPIWLFVAIYVLASMRWVGGMSPAKVRVWSAVVVAIGIAIAVMTGMEGGGEVAEHGHSHAPSSDPFNGSLQYLPALIALLFFTAVSYRRGQPTRGWLLAATLTFLVSLTFRSLDIRFCSALPIGLHFLWHLLNGAMLGILLQFLIRSLPATKR